MQNRHTNGRRALVPWRLAPLAAVCFCFTTAAPSAYAEPQDRQVAEWTILLGGSVRVEGRPERFRDLTKLPTDDFYLELVDLVGTNVLPPDLKWLSGLKRLKVLNLPGPMWNPSSGATIDYSRNLKHLASLPALEELTFSYTYLESIKIVETGIDEIGPRGPTLSVQRLENTQVRGRHLADRR